jgi:hypothetical protein
MKRVLTESLLFYLDVGPFFVQVGDGLVECDAVHVPVVERGAIVGGCKTWLAAHTLWADAAGGQAVGQDLLAHQGVDGHHDAVGDGNLTHHA